MGAQDEPGDSPFTQDMDQLKAELLATVSHELRSPLASIKGYTATLLRHERRISREERHEFLVAIQEASNRLELIIDHLLELSQLETGAIQLTSSAVDVARLVREAITVAQQRVSDNTSDRVTFQLHLKDTAGRLTHQQPLIKADRRRLREVLDHLLENAINYSPEGGAIDIILRPVLPGKVHFSLYSQGTSTPCRTRSTICSGRSLWSGSLVKSRRTYNGPIKISVNN